MTAQRAVKARRVLFLVVDAGRGPSGDWAQSMSGPTAPEIVRAAADTAIDSGARFQSYGLSSNDVGMARYACPLALRLVGSREPKVRFNW
jgi:NTE family protein